MSARSGVPVAIQRVLKLGPLVALRGGPYARWWYTETDWLARLDTEERMRPLEERRTAVLHRYVKTNMWEDNPTFAGVRGQVWRWPT